MSKIMLISPKDNNFYNFRSELILKLTELKSDVVLVCPYGKKIDYFTQRGCRFIDISMDRRGTSIFNDLKLNFWWIRMTWRISLKLISEMQHGVMPLQQPECHCLISG